MAPTCMSDRLERRRQHAGEDGLLLAVCTYLQGSQTNFDDITVNLESTLSLALPKDEYM